MFFYNPNKSRKNGLSTMELRYLLIKWQQYDGFTPKFAHMSSSVIIKHAKFRATAYRHSYPANGESSERFRPTRWPVHTPSNIAMNAAFAHMSATFDV